MFRTKRFQLIELIVPATVTAANSNVMFGNQPQLQSILGDNVYVKAIEVFSDRALAASPLSTGTTVANSAAIRNATLTLLIKGEESMQKIPLTMLSRIFTDTGGTFVPNVYQLFLLKNIFEVDWTKSYLTLVAAPAAPPLSYLFGIHYDYDPDPMDVPIM